jgi:hypothetical protein
LTDIFLGIAKKQKIEVDSEVEKSIEMHFEKNETGGTEGNGRYARKLFDRSFAAMAIRASKLDAKNQADYLAAITKFQVSDIPEYINPKPKQKQRIGFAPEDAN